VNLWVGVPAALLAAVAGVTALASTTGRIVAGIVAVAAAGFGAVAATLNAPKRAEVAEAAGVPMARGRSFAETDPSAGLAYAMGLSHDGTVVVKTDGLAAGKGVTVCGSLDEAVQAISGQRGAFIIEERLTGREASVIAICDGEHAVALPVSRDHKRLGDGDSGQRA